VAKNAMRIPVSCHPIGIHSFRLFL